LLAVVQVPVHISARVFVVLRYAGLWAHRVAVVGFVRLGEIGDTTQGTTGLVAVFHSTYFFSLRGVPGEEHDLPVGCIVSLATVECIFGGEKLE
jgi:hypothetical protein